MNIYFANSVQTLNGIKVRVFFEKTIEKKHLSRHDKKYDQSFKKYEFVKN